MTPDRLPESPCRERPILFSAPMVRAILDGRKTQTRRAVKLPDDARQVAYWSPPGGRSREGWADPGVNYWTDRGNHIDACPYGQPGDRLWVRETHVAFDERTPENTGEVFYRADDEYKDMGFAWTPSIFMRRQHSRITLEITGVRVERLQQISGDDAFAEGIDTEGDAYCEGESLQSAGSPVSPERYAFATLWRSINGDASWDASPWVWVVEFRRAA